MAITTLKTEKLRIIPERDPKNKGVPNDFFVMFNPTTYSISKSVSWVSVGKGNHAKTNSPPSRFGGGSPRVLSLELFYDVTESGDANPDVRTETQKVVQLTQLRRDQNNLRPPICEIHWGEAKGDFPFTGTVSKLDQQFLLFSESGRPLRATLKVAFTEFLSMRDDQLKTDPDLTTRVVRRGDSLASIAAEAYGDPATWRVIAAANRIENPLSLAAGTKLTLPKK